MKKWILRIIVLFIILIIVGSFSAKSFLTRDYLVAAIEKSINSRIQIKEIDVNLLGLSGTVNLKNIIITQRDDTADQNIPHDKRDAIENGDIQLGMATFNISLWEILTRKILVENIHIDGVTLNLTLYENGDNSIEKLFAKPGADRDKMSEKFNANENESFVTTINHINVTDVSFNLIIEKTKLVVIGTEAYLNLLDINVNPKKLDTVNDATIKLGGKFDIQPFESEVKTDYGKIIFSGESNITLFNADNGDIEPDMVIALTLDSDSYLTSEVPVISKLWKAGDLLNKFGIKSLNLPDKIAFKNDQSVRVGYKLGTSTLLDPIAIKIYDWKLEALPQSWISSGNDLHQLEVTLQTGEAITNKLGGLLNKSSKAASVLEKITGENGSNSWLENGKLTLHLESSGELSNPKIKVKNDLSKPASDIIDNLLGDSDEKEEDPLKKAGKDLLKGFLK